MSKRPTFILDSEQSLNDMSLETLRSTIKRAKGNSITDVVIRINGEEKRFEGDWIKYLEEVVDES